MTAPDAAAAPEKVLRIGLSGVVDTLNPFTGLTEESLLFFGLVYDRLQSVDESMNPTSNLATDWWVVPGTEPETGEPFGSVWQYNLTTNAEWHDGVPLTAADVVFTMNLNCEYYSLMWAYQPYSHFIHFAEAIDSHTVRIHFYDRTTGEPCPAAYGYMLDIPILPKHRIVEAGYDAGYLGFEWNGLYPESSPPLVGSGPYMATSSVLEEWTSGDCLTLVRNPDYHFQTDKGLSAYFDKIELRTYGDPSLVTAAIEAGEADLARLSPAEYRNLSTRAGSGELGNMTLLETESCRGDAIVASFSVGGSIWGMTPNQMICDPAVRGAIEWATNKSQIIDEPLSGYGVEGSTIISSASTWHYEPTPDERTGFDLEVARQILENAGYVDTDEDGTREATEWSYAVQNGLAQVGDELELEMAVLGSDSPEFFIGKMLEAQWLEAGVRVDLKILADPVMAWPLCPFGLYDVGIAHRTAEMDPVHSLIQCSERMWETWADSRWLNRSFEDEFNQSVTTLDSEDRKVYVDNCQRIHYAEKPQIVLAYPHSLYALRTDRYDASQWGNWSADPGLSLENTWGALPLLFLDFVEPDDGAWSWAHWALVAGAVGGVVAATGAVVYFRRK